MNHLCKEIKISISWGSIAGKLWTPKAPTPRERILRALALHGWHDNAASFDPLIPYLPQNMTLLAIDLPGHGYSDHYNEKVAYHWASFLSDVIEVLYKLCWKRPILIGHSFGGLLACAAAATLQNEINKLILIESLYFDINALPDQFFSDYTEHKYQKPQKFHEKRIYSSKIEVAKAILNANKDLFTLSTAEVLAERACKEEEGGFVLTRDKRMDIITLTYIRSMYWTILFQTFCDRFTMPLLCIHGKETRFKFEELLERDGIKLPASSHIITLEGGHMVHMTSPLQVGKVITEFVTQRFTSKL